MSELVIISMLAGIIQAAFWLWVKTLITKLDKATEALSQLQLNVAANYVSKADMREHLERNEKTLSELKSYLAAKA